MKKRVKVNLLKERGHTRSDGKNIVRSLFKHGAVETSFTRAKKLKSLVDRLINYGFKEELTGRRLINQKVAHLVTTNKILEYAKKLKGTKKSGFTSLKKVGFHRGDATLVARLTLIDYLPKVIVQAKTEVKEVKKQNVKKS